MENNTSLTVQQTGFVERMLTKIESLEEATKFGAFIIKSGFAPPHYKTPEQVILAVDAGMRLGFTWSQALQEGYIVGNIPSYKAMAFKALVLNSGLCEKWENEWKGSLETNDLTIIITTRRKGAEKDMVREYSITNAKMQGLWGKEGGWKKTPDIMLESRCSARVCEKDYPDVCKGFKTVETAEDYPTEEVNEAGMTIKSLAIEKADAMIETAKKEKPASKRIQAGKVETPIIKVEETKSEPNKSILEGIEGMKGPDLWQRLVDNWTLSIDPMSLFTTANPRNVTATKALLNAIDKGTLVAHLSEKYGISIDPIQKNIAEVYTEGTGVIPSEGVSTIPEWITQPSSTGRPMPEAVKVSEWMETTSKNAQEICDMYPDNFNDVEDMFVHITIEQLVTALS